MAEECWRYSRQETGGYVTCRIYNRLKAACHDSRVLATSFATKTCHVSQRKAGQRDKIRFTTLTSHRTSLRYHRYRSYGAIRLDTHPWLILVLYTAAERVSSPKGDKYYVRTSHRHSSLPFQSYPSINLLPRRKQIEETSV